MKAESADAAIFLLQLLPSSSAWIVQTATDKRATAVAWLRGIWAEHQVLLNMRLSHTASVKLARPFAFWQSW